MEVDAHGVTLWPGASRSGASLEHEPRRELADGEHGQLGPEEARVDQAERLNDDRARLRRVHDDPEPAARGLAGIHRPVAVALDRPERHGPALDAELRMRRALPD